MGGVFGANRSYRSWSPWKKQKCVKIVLGLNENIHENDKDDRKTTNSAQGSSAAEDQISAEMAPHTREKSGKSRKEEKRGENGKSEANNSESSEDVGTVLRFRGHSVRLFVQ